MKTALTGAPGPAGDTWAGAPPLCHAPTSQEEPRRRLTGGAEGGSTQQVPRCIPPSGASRKADFNCKLSARGSEAVRSLAALRMPVVQKRPNYLSSQTPSPDDIYSTLNQNIKADRIVVIF